MRILIEHLKLRTIPHDLVEFFQEVPFYEGCMIVQIHDHKSTAPSQGATRPTSNVGKTVPFSVHNYNYHITPSSYVPYPTQTNGLGKGKGSSDGDVDEKTKTAEQKDKENMPAPAFPMDGQRGKAATQPKKPKISTIVLRPTPLSAHVDLAMKAADTLSNGDGRRDSRQDGPLSATVPPTPTAVVPPTPQSSMAPPAKRQKKNKLELNSNNIYDAEAQIALATTAPLVLEPVSNAAACSALLKSLSHPMHSEKPPSPKTRKRTVAEMAADEALAAEQERYLLILDERLSGTAVNAQGGGNPADGDGQAGGASFEPRFERFKTLENIKNQHEENKRLEKQRNAETERKAQQERERERLRMESEKKDQERVRLAQQQQQQAQQQELRRRQLAQQAQVQGLQGMPGQIQGQHAHPPTNNIVPNGMQSQPQRFHNQQVSQAQVSSPIVRNGTPQSHSSPTVNNMGNAMQHSTSSMGGSPPRPGSVVQNHPQMGPQGHGMVAQRSQHSHAGTPRMPNSTPQIQSTPLNRPMSQTPRMSQGSPVQVSMAQAQAPMMMGNGQMAMNNNPLAQQQRMAMIRQQQQQNGQGMGGIGQQMSPQQAFHMAQQAQAARIIAQQQQQQQQGGGMQMGNNTQQIQQQYAAQMAAMGQQGMQQAAMNRNFGSNGQPMTQQQQLQLQMQQQYRMQQAQQQAQAQAQAQVHGMQQQTQQHPQQGMNPIIASQIRQQASIFYRERLPAFQLAHPNGPTVEADRALRAQCQADAQATVLRIRRAQMAQQQQMMAQGGGMQQNMSMANGLSM